VLCRGRSLQGSWPDATASGRNKTHASLPCESEGPPVRCPLHLHPARCLVFHLGLPLNRQPPLLLPCFPLSSGELLCGEHGGSTRRHKSWAGRSESLPHGPLFGLWLLEGLHPRLPLLVCPLLCRLLRLVGFLTPLGFCCWCC
jgi:hypothetical protein